MSLGMTKRKKGIVGRKKNVTDGKLTDEKNREMGIQNVRKKEKMKRKENEEKRK